MQSASSEDGFLRHVRACNNVTLPGRRLPFRIGETQVGWVLPTFRDALARFPRIRAEAGGVTLTDPGSLQDIARALADEGLHRWRGEAFDVRAEPDGPVLAVLDRGALPSFGVRAVGVHVNGLVRRADGVHVWIGWRSPHKTLDPGKIDHITAGGVPAGMTAIETLIKEAEEEASLPREIARRAVLAGEIAYTMEREEGLRRDVLYCYDIDLPATFEPKPGDDEVASFELWPLARALETVRDTDNVKFNVNLVLIDLFLREGLIVGEQARRLRAALAAGKA